MLELDAQIREYIDATSEPLTAADILREADQQPAGAVPSGRAPKRGLLIAAAAAIGVLLLGVVPLLLTYGARDAATNTTGPVETTQPETVTTTGNQTTEADETWSSVDGEETESLQGTFRVKWTDFVGPLDLPLVEEVWTRPPTLAAIGSGSTIDARWVIPHTLCTSRNCRWLESDDGIDWNVGGPQPPGGEGSIYTWVEQGVILNFLGWVPTESYQSTIDSAGTGRPLPAGSIMLPGRESPSGMAVCAQSTSDGLLAINAVAPLEPSQTWYGDPVPRTSFWMIIEDEFHLRGTAPESLARADSCSAGFLNDTLYAFYPEGKTGTLWALDDGVWLEQPFSHDFPHEIHQIIYAGQRVFVVAGENRSDRSVWTSTDFVGWEQAVTPWNNGSLDTIRSGPNGWDIKSTDFGWLAVAVDAQELFLSIDGIQWEPMPTPFWVPAGPGAVSRLNIAYADGLFLMTSERVGQPVSNTPEYIGRLIQP